MRSIRTNCPVGWRSAWRLRLALTGRPQLLLADEPTTALDVTVQAQVLELLVGLRDETGMAIVLVTHDLGIVAQYVDRVAVMRHGKVVEQAPVRTLFTQPAHDYTRQLLATLPRSDAARAPVSREGGGPAAPGARAEATFLRTPQAAPARRAGAARGRRRLLRA